MAKTTFWQLEDPKARERKNYNKPKPRSKVKKDAKEDSSTDKDSKQE